MLEIAEIRTGEKEMIPNFRQAATGIILGCLLCFPAGLIWAGVTLDTTDINDVQDTLIRKIDAEFINDRAIRMDAAVRTKNETNETFVQEHEEYKELLLDLSRQVSKLSSEKETIETKKADLLTVLKNREAEFERLKKNIDRND